MKNIQNEIKKIERKDWHLWILTSGVFLSLVTFVLLLIFYSDVRNLYEKEFSSYTYNLLFVGFTGISLLFLAYILLKEKSIKKLRQELYKEKVFSQSLEERFQELKALFEVSTLVNSEIELSLILDMISKTVRDYLQTDRCSVLLFDKKKKKLVCVSAHGVSSEKIKNTELNPGESVAGWVMTHGEPLLLGDELQEDKFKNFVSKEEKISSSLSVPLKVKNVVKGVLNVCMVKGERKFNEMDLKLVSIFAQNVAVSIEKTELYQEVKKQAEVLEKTLEDLKKTQGQLIQSEKMRVLGDLAEGIVHDFNNILGIITGRAELLLKQAKEEGLIKGLMLIEQVANDGAEIIRRLWEYTKIGQESIFIKVDLNKILRQVVELTSFKWKDEALARGININIDMDLKEINPIAGNPSEIREVFVNLLLNAIEALPKGGKIILGTRMENDYVLAWVKDAGIGMKEEVKSKIFEPFYTLKGEKGMGLGLTIASGIVSKHQGTMSVDSELGEGTCIWLKFPVSRKAREEEEKITVIDFQPANILVIEDEKNMRDIILEMLSEQGHSVTLAVDGKQGIEFFKRGIYDLVLTNLSMPEMSGWEVIREIKSANPYVKVALMTGCGTQTKEEEAKAKGADFLISKPFKKNQLLFAVSEAIKKNKNFLPEGNLICKKS
ncbi:MAG: response regulator [candidate division Zixibacteria bacterium]|nr:response regulator [candidate division Zixibacteria bacterium]